MPGPGVIAIIPARIASTRFPRKMLAADTGRPLIAHVCEAAARAPMVTRVVVATDSEEIARAARAQGAEAVMTSPSHPNGASRIDEAAQTLGLPDAQVIVNVQGDEPELDPAILEAAALALEGADIGTVATPFGAEENPADPNLVKVVRRVDGSALYFSRALIPHGRDGAQPELLRHVGVYAYKRSFLRRYAALAPTPLEQSEKLEQLRALEHGFTIGVAVRDSRHQGIDTPGQYAAFVARWSAAQRGR